ncbi:MAG: hypothetical protein M3270_10365 [Thermoproteota archaeon]|nr:hypothetical protein [Thermoproteota archaeon]
MQEEQIEHEESRDVEITSRLAAAIELTLAHTSVLRPNYYHDHHKASE